MTITDWILDIALILVVLRQLRPGRIDARFVLLPLAIVAWVGHMYLTTLPTTGNDVPLIGLGIGVGALFGVGGGLTTRVWRERSGRPMARAGVVAATMWVVSMAGRMGFYIWTTHGGGAAVAQFSAAHALTEAGWTTAFVLMAFTEVVLRVGTIVLRAARTPHPSGQYALAG